MLDSNNKINRFFQHIKKEASLLSSISLGVFFFVLFFQPFELNKFDFNNRLVFEAGFAAIVFLFMILVRYVLSDFLIIVFKNKLDSVFHPYVDGSIIFLFSSLALAFYLRYVGTIQISFFTMLKVLLINMFPPAVLKLYDSFQQLEQQNEDLFNALKSKKNQLKKIEAKTTDETITFLSNSKTEKINLRITDVVFLKSADNYVEIVLLEKERFRKKLIRNSLKNIANQIIQNPNFIRCHRTFIINLMHVEKLIRKNNQYWLILNNYTELVPISRQYLILIKEKLAQQMG
ncbi:MAG: LytTR family transcriptional regulator DNA-binding domain-containing protein [Prolixibacteraceae bacterium]|jgi:DNA-binding LytR/AlgR family response regulator|nr:LytTR family transcriptional regulator DNA-binding domain-containing protein [Prolixibacteraceae bacterium]